MSFDASNECHQSQHSIVSSELNLNSLSSDSGLHTGKTSEMSSGDFNNKFEGESPSIEETVTTECDGDECVNAEPSSNQQAENRSDDSPVRTLLSRNNSVKSKVNIFQDLENRQKLEPIQQSVRPQPKRSKT